MSQEKVPVKRKAKMEYLVTGLVVIFLIFVALVVSLTT